MKFGERLTQLRKDRKISQEQMAEDLGVTRQTISNWENYKNYPDIAMLTMISDKYKISLDDLLKKDVEYVNKMDEKMKWGSKNKIILLTTILIVVSVSIISYFGIKYYYYRRVLPKIQSEHVVVNVGASINPIILGKPTDDNINELKNMGIELRYAKYKNLNVPISKDAIIEDIYNSKDYDNTNNEHSNMTIIDSDKKIVISDFILPLTKNEEKLLKEMIPNNASADPITAAKYIGNNYLKEISIFTPINEMKKIELYIKLLSLIQGNVESEDKVQEDGLVKLKYTHMLCPVDGPYIANLVPSFTVESGVDVLDIIHNGRMYEIKYTGYTQNELMELIEFINFD